MSNDTPQIPAGALDAPGPLRRFTDARIVTRMLKRYFVTHVDILGKVFFVCLIFA